MTIYFNNLLKKKIKNSEKSQNLHVNRKQRIHVSSYYLNCYPSSRCYTYILWRRKVLTKCFLLLTKDREKKKSWFSSLKKLCFIFFSFNQQIRFFISKFSLFMLNLTWKNLPLPCKQQYSLLSMQVYCYKLTNSWWQSWWVWFHLFFHNFILFNSIPVSLILALWHI